LHASRRRKQIFDPGVGRSRIGPLRRQNDCGAFNPERRMNAASRLLVRAGPQSREPAAGGREIGGRVAPVIE
jgi:hypothetical protein